MRFQQTYFALIVATIVCLAFEQSARLHADIVSSSETFGGTLLAISNDAAQSATVQNGTAVFGAPGQTFTNMLQTDIDVVTSQNSLGGSDWQLVMNFTASDGNSFISPGSTMGSTGDEINAWTMYIGDTIQSSDALNLLQSANYNSVEGQWKSNGATLLTVDVLSNFNGDPNSISGFISIGVPPGGNVGVYDESSDLGTFGIDELTLTFNVNVVPEPASAALVSLLGIGFLFRRNRPGILTRSV